MKKVTLALWLIAYACIETFGQCTAILDEFHYYHELAIPDETITNNTLDNFDHSSFNDHVTYSPSVFSLAGSTELTTSDFDWTCCCAANDIICIGSIAEAAYFIPEQQAGNLLAGTHIFVIAGSGHGYYNNFAPGYHLVVTTPDAIDHELGHRLGANHNSPPQGTRMDASPSGNSWYCDRMEEIQSELGCTVDACSPLPVELTTFSGQSKDNTVLLSWVTTSETNNDYFQIERSIDGQQWELIGSVEGNGTTIIEQSYEFVDHTLFSGNNYYRLKQVDLDGSFSYSKIITVDFQQTHTITIYPNPADNYLYIQWSNDQNNQDYGYHIYNQFGQLVASGLVTEAMTGINLSNLPKGVYYLNGGNKNLSASFRFIKL